MKNRSAISDPLNSKDSKNKINLRHHSENDERLSNASAISGMSMMTMNLSDSQYDYINYWDANPEEVLRLYFDVVAILPIFIIFFIYIFYS